MNHVRVVLEKNIRIVAVDNQTVIKVTILIKQRTWLFNCRDQVGAASNPCGSGKKYKNCCGR